MGNCTIDNSDSTVLSIRIIKTTLPILSLVTCVGAIALLVYYKFYHSFNYRLILYLLLSHVLNATVNSLQVLYIWDVLKATGKLRIFCITVSLLKVYCTWNVELSTAIIILEVFFMVVFSYKLDKEERLLLAICFFIPILAAFVPLTTESYGRSQFHTCGFQLSDDCHYSIAEVIDDYVSGTIITSICMAAITVAMCRLVYLGLRFRRNASGEHNLLDKRVRIRYQNALKQTLPFAVYPMLSMVSLVIYYIHIMTNPGRVLECVFQIITGCTGAFSSGIFFIHVYLLGSKQRNVFKYHRRAYKSIATINEGQTLTTERSMTWTNVTHSEFPCESDVESQ